MMFAAAGRLRIAGSTGSESTEERTRSGWLARPLMEFDRVAQPNSIVA
jgi:hypothetical protein